MRVADILSVHGLQIEQYAQPCSITTICWVESIEDGDRFIERAVTTAEQFDAVMVEYLSALKSAYRPA